MPTAVDPTAPPQVTVTASGKWRGVLGLMDAWSADARMLEAPEAGGAVRARPLPLPLLVQPELAPGHDGGKLGVGVIDRIWTQDGFVMGEGRFDMADPYGADLARKVGEGFIRFVSLDVDDATAHQVCLDSDGTTVLEDCDPNQPGTAMGMVYTGWRVMGATLLAHPAFPDAHIALADDSTAPTPETAQAAVRLADSAPGAPGAPGGEIVGYNPDWGCVVPNADGTAWEKADCAAEGAVQANPTGDGPYDPEAVTAEANDTPDVPEEEVTDEGTGCVAPDPANEGQWLPAPCDQDGAVPANEDGTGPLEEVTDAANTADGTMAITSFAVDTSLPWAERDREWDGDQARQNVAGWATTGEGENAKLDPAKMSRAFLVVDGPEDNQGSYKYGVADMVDGELKLVWNGVTAANAALNGARGGGDVPGKREALADIKTLYGKAAEAFDDPSITDNEGAMATVPMLADTPPNADADSNDPADPAGKDRGNGCVCEQEDGTYAPCDCALDDAETADPDGNPVDDDDRDNTEMATVPEGCEPCQAVAITASASTDTTAAPGFTPLAEWFDNPQLSAPQPITVDPATGRLVGHLAAWGTCHVGFRDRCVTPPRSASGYGFFHTARIPTTAGHLDVGIITMDTGHAPLEMTAASTISHYDNTGTQAAVVRVGEDSHGIWVAGVTLPFVSAEERLRLSLASFSGDWRHIRGGAELVAALAVNTPGFPMPARKTGTDNAEYALTAAGFLPPARKTAVMGEAGTERYVPLANTSATTVDPAAVAQAVLSELDARDQRRARLARVTAQLGAVRDATTAERVQDATRSIQALAAGLAADRVTLARQKVTGLDIEIPKGIRALKSDVEFMGTKVYANWVDEQGGLPRKIKSVAKELQKKGMGESQSIAVAVNVAKKACSSGDTNWPGKQSINAKSRAEYCAAVARWEAMKAAARAS